MLRLQDSIWSRGSEQVLRASSLDARREHGENSSSAVRCRQVAYHTLSEAHPTSPGSPSDHHTLSRRPRTRHSYTEICGDPHRLTLSGQTREWTVPVRQWVGRARLGKANQGPQKMNRVQGPALTDLLGDLRTDSGTRAYRSSPYRTERSSFSHAGRGSLSVLGVLESWERLYSSSIESESGLTISQGDCLPYTASLTSLINSPYD